MFTTSHANHHLTVQEEDPRRNIRTSPVRKYRDSISALSPPTTISTRKRVLKEIHTTTVRNTINNYGVNKVLGTKPPEIHDAESQLSRTTRSTLSQLRSGYSPFLNNYLHRIDHTIPNVCPLCASTPHDVQHLFNCTANPTSLSVIDLWKKPVEAAIHLGLKTEKDTDE